MKDANFTPIFNMFAQVYTYGVTLSCLPKDSKKTK